MSTQKLSASLRMSGSEIFTAAEAPSASGEDQRTIRAAANGLDANFDANSTPPLNKPIVSLSLTMTTGSATSIDLTAVDGLAIPAGDRTVDVTGGKLIGYILRAPATNAAAITVSPGASNPYPLNGTGNDLEIKPGQRVASVISGVATSMPAVAAGAKTIDVDGTTGDVLYLDLYFGA